VLLLRCGLIVVIIITIRRLSVMGSFLYKLYNIATRELSIAKPKVT